MQPPNVDHIGGWFDFHHFYDRLVEECPDGGNIAEIGVWLGKSVCYMGLKAQQLGKFIRITAIDEWPNEYEGVVSGDSYKQFLENLYSCSLMSVVHPLRCESSSSAVLFPDYHFFAVFIDGDHSYEGVTRDLKAWLLKVKPGGYLCGHDFSTAHPGVIAALADFFGPANPNMEYDGSVWIYRTPLLP